MSLAESPADRVSIPCLVPVLSEQCIRGCYLYYDNLLTTPTYLQAFYKADAGFIQSALGGLNLFYHRAHKCVHRRWTRPSVLSIGRPAPLVGRRLQVEQDRPLQSRGAACLIPEP